MLNSLHYHYKVLKQSYRDVDYSLHRLFWTDLTTSEIEYVSLDGSGRTSFLSGGAGSAIFGVTIFEVSITLIMTIPRGRPAENLDHKMVLDGGDCRDT